MGRIRKGRAGKRAREKGIQFEQYVANAMRDAGWPEARRDLSQRRDGGEAPDVLGFEAGLWPECEHAAKADPWRKLAQAYEAQGYKPWTGHDYVPVAIVKRNGKDRPPLACMEFGDFLRIVREWRERGEYAEQFAKAMNAANPISPTSPEPSPSLPQPKDRPDAK